MTITLIRHAKVKLIWKKKCTSAEFDEDCRLYDIAPVEEMTDAPELKAEKVFISGLDRTLQTAKQLFGDRDFMKSDKINEVPLRSAFDTGLHLPLWFWNFSGRLQWFFNSRRQLESKNQTRKRAEEFVKELMASGDDCTLVTHGFFMHTLMAVMNQNGFKEDKSSLHYKNGEMIILRK